MGIWKLLLATGVGLFVSCGANLIHGQTSAWGQGGRNAWNGGVSFERLARMELDIPNSGVRKNSTNISFVAGSAATYEDEFTYDPQFVQVYHTSRIRTKYTWPWNGTDGWNSAIGETLVTTQPFPGVPYYESTITYPHSTATAPLYTSAISLPREKVSLSLFTGPFPGTSRSYYDSSSKIKVVNYGNPLGKEKMNPFVQPLMLGSDFRIYNSGSALTAAQITVNGIGLNCDSEHVVGVEVDGETEVTVANTAGISSYSFGITPQLPKLARFSRAYHPSFPFPPELSALQSLFDTGSRNRLANDADGCSANGGAADDVETYVEFDVFDGAPVTFPAPWSHPNYFFIVELSKMYNLANNSAFEFVMQVQQLPEPFDGYSGPRSIILDAYSTDQNAVHEWAHTGGVWHRGTPTNPDTAGFTNTEFNNPPPDPEALMCSRVGQVAGSNTEVNRSERPLMLSW